MLTETPRQLDAVRASVPPSVADAVHTALEKLPADRFATVAEFASALVAERAVDASRALRRARGARVGTAAKRIQIVQIPYNVADRAVEQDVLPLAAKLALGVLVTEPYLPRVGPNMPRRMRPRGSRRGSIQTRVCRAPRHPGVIVY